MKRGYRTFLLTVLTLCFGTSYSQIAPPSPSPPRDKGFHHYRRRCFKVTPCTMFANRDRHFGCAQCDSDVVRGSVVEFATREELTTFINARQLKRVVMIPEFLFYDQSMLSILESAQRIAALVVYAGDSPNYRDQVNNTVPLSFPPVEDLSVDNVEPNVRHNFYPSIIVQDDSASSDYENPETIVKNIRKQASNLSLINVRNSYGTGLKFRYFPFNVFHVKQDIAEEIRNLSRRFGDTKIIGALQPDNSGRSATTPNYKLESMGRMYACPTITAAPPPTNEIPPTPSPSLMSAEPETDEEDDAEESRRNVLHADELFDYLVSPSPSSSPSPLPSNPPLKAKLKSVRQNGPDDVTEVPTTDSAKCLSEKTCLPIGGQSVWSVLGRLKPRVNDAGEILPSATGQRTIALMAPLDSMSFFPDFSYGASAEISSVAVLLAVAEAVGNYWRRQWKGEDRFDLQPAYMAWNAQSWGWAGSSRFLKDLDQFKCENFTVDKRGCKAPFMESLKFLDLKNISRLEVINIGQLISPNAIENFNLEPEMRNHFYFDTILKENKKDDSSNKANFRCPERNETLFKLFNERRQLSKSSEVRFTDYTHKDNVTLYPLDASQSFKRYYSNNQKCQFDIISINNYQYNFTNRYYHSIFDQANLTANQPKNDSGNDEERSKQGNNSTINEYRRPLYVMAKLIAQVVALKAFGDHETLNSLDIEPKTVDDVITCLTSNNWTECELKDKFLSKLQMPSNDVVNGGNYAGSFFPSTRVRDLAPSWAAKLSLLQNMFAYFNRYDLSKSLDQSEDSIEPTFDPSGASDENESSTLECSTTLDCKELNETANANVTMSTEWHTVFCSRKQCVLSDTYLHDAFGTAIKRNKTHFQFEFKDDHKAGEEPASGGWTESLWEEQLGLCGYAEDTRLYGIIVLGSGIVIFILTFALYFYFDHQLHSQIVVTDSEETPLTRQLVPP